MQTTYVQYGCGLCAPPEWINFDASLTVRLQRIPALGKIFKKKIKPVFPDNVRYGNIVKGLPIEDNSCDGIYASHILEHLSLEDFRTALRNTYRLLKQDGIFRCIVPDLEHCARKYLASLENGDNEANFSFLAADAILGIKKKPTGLKGAIISIWGNAHHLWMWDSKSLINELQKCGFKELRICQFNDSKDKMFKYAEDQVRFENAVAIECTK